MITTPAPWRAAAMVVAASALILAPAAGAATTPGPAASVPASFKAASITWRSGSHGWILGSAPCGTNSCATVATTSNGGTSWRLAGQLATPIASVDTPSDVGVSLTEFASPQVGWAYGPALYRTSDGGQAWGRRALPGNGKQVLSMASSPAGTYALISPCKEFAPKCTATSLTLWRASDLLVRQWHRIPLNLPINASASVAALGMTVYVVDPGVPGLLYASTDGRTFSARHSPCIASQGVGLVQAVPTSATNVALLCTGNPGISKATKTVYLSTDTGRTDTSAGTTPAFGIDAELAASTSGNLLVGAWANGSWMYLNDSHAKAWSTPLGLGDGGAGFASLAFVTSKVAWTVYGPVSHFPADFGKLYVTRDGGQHWQLVTP